MFNELPGDVSAAGPRTTLLSTKRLVHACKACDTDYGI